MTLPFDHTHDLDLGVSRSESEIAFSQEQDGQLTWNEKYGSYTFMTMILTSVTMMGFFAGFYLERGMWGIPPEITTCPPNFGKSGDRSPHIWQNLI